MTTSSLPAQEALALNSDRLVLCTEIQHLARESELVIVPPEDGPKRQFAWRPLKNVKPSTMQLHMITQFAEAVGQDPPRGAKTAGWLTM